MLECLSESLNLELEQPRREWFKENKPLHNSPTGPDAERFYFTESKELLVIVNAQSTDAGHYRCEISDNLRTLTLQSELIVVQGSLNNDLVLLSVMIFTIICVLICTSIVWRVLRHQRRKQLHSSTTRSSQHTLPLDQTQLTTMNRTILLDTAGHKQQQQLDQQQPQHQHHQSQSQLRPRSLTDLECGPGQTQSRLIVTTTPSYEQRCMEQGLTLCYMQQAELELQQDHLSSKDSGTGSDAAVKRSLEDFVVGMPRRRILDEDADVDDDDDVGDEPDDNDLQFAPTRALGVSVYHDMDELYERNHSAPEQQSFLRNNNNNRHNYDGGGCVMVGVAMAAAGDYKAAKAVDI